MFSYNTSIPQGGYAGPDVASLKSKKGPSLSDIFMSPYQKGRAVSNPQAMAGAQRQSDDAYRSAKWAGIRDLERNHALTNADLQFQQAQASAGNAMQYFNSLLGAMQQQNQMQQSMQNPQLINYILSNLFAGGF